MKELVIVSGKGGTGKTSVAAALATLAPSKVIADCDVDAADLHLVLDPRVLHTETFWAGHEASINPALCAGCGKCAQACRFGSIHRQGGSFQVQPLACEGCGACALVCPADAVRFEPRRAGEWHLSATRAGTLVHAHLSPAAENSGKLVSKVKNVARQAAADENTDLLLVDGPPGIGCPVIASLSGATLALVVVEPTVAGAHDLERAVSLLRHFNVPALLCVNKWDINPEMSETIIRSAAAMGLPSAGSLSFDPEVTHAQLAQQSVVEHLGAKRCPEWVELWERVREALGRS